MAGQRKEFPTEFPIDHRIVPELPASKIEKCFSKDSPRRAREIDERYEKAVKISFSESEQEWVCEEAYLRFKETPFQEGTFRKCYEMWEKGRWKENRMVAKIFKDEENAQKYFDEAMLQLIASQYAHQFNTMRCGRKISFLPVSIFKLLERGNQFITAEPYLEGKYVKHNDNDGHVDTDDPLPQAFSHFTWEASGRKLLICDIQGVGDTYTDPSICSMTDCDDECFGSSDRGPAAIRSFFASHRCNSECVACGLEAHRGPEHSQQVVGRAGQHDGRRDTPRRGRSLWTVGKAYGKSLIHALGMSGGARHKSASDSPLRPQGHSALARSPSTPGPLALANSPRDNLKESVAKMRADEDSGSGSGYRRMRGRDGPAASRAASG